MSSERNLHWLGGINYSWITENLAVGGFRGSGWVDGKLVKYTDEQMLDDAAQAFDVVVLCCDETQPSSDHVTDATVIHMGFREQLRGPIQLEILRLIEGNIPRLDKLLTKDSTMLCSCAMGAARSPFVAATLLKYRGMPAKEAIELIQRKRVFSNFLYMDHLIHGDDDYEAKWLPTLEQRREEYWRNR